MEGGVSVLRISPIFTEFGFPVFALNSAFFGFVVLRGLCGVFTNLVFGFRFLLTVMANFWIFPANTFYGF